MMIWIGIWVKPGSGNGTGIGSGYVCLNSNRDHDLLTGGGYGLSLDIGNGFRIRSGMRCTRSY